MYFSSRSSDVVRSVRPYFLTNLRDEPTWVSGPYAAHGGAHERSKRREVGALEVFWRVDAALVEDAVHTVLEQLRDELGRALQLDRALLFPLLHRARVDGTEE